MHQKLVRRSWPVWIVLLAIAFAQGCEGDAASDTADGSSAGAGGSGDGGDSFVVGPNGTTHTLTLPNGQALTFAFPASAAGQTITLRLADDGDYGVEGEHPNLVEMLPHGLAFDPPVLVTPDWSGAVPVLRTFADAAGAKTPELLAIASDKKAFELPHFSLLSVNAIDYNCPFPGTKVAGISTLCKATQNEVTFYCDNTTLCLAIEAHCCTDIVGNPNMACTELLDYGSVPINAPPCGTVDAGVDAAPDAATDAPNEGSGGAGGSGGTGSGGSGGSGGGPVGGCPQTGYYTVAASGACGDLNTQAPLQRLDGTGCNLYWEYDGGSASKGIGSGALSYNPSGVTSGLSIDLGSAAYTCTVTAAHPSVTMACTATAGTCNLSLTHTGPL
jgi:hypothetical protein